MDENFLRVAVLLLLLKGTHEKDVFNELTEKYPTSSTDSSRKKVKSETYVRATTLEEFIEVERTDDNGVKSYKVEAKLEPFEVLQPIKEVIRDEVHDLKVTLELKNLKIGGINKLKIHGNSITNKNKDEANINFDLPEAVKLTSTYAVNGAMENRKIKGDGVLDIIITGASVHGIVQITDDGQELRIQHLNLAYEFKSIQLNYTGLQIEGMNTIEAEELVKRLTKKYLKENSEMIRERLATDVRIKLNRKLKGISSTKILLMLKGV